MESTQTIKFDALVVDTREKPGGNRDNVLSLWDNNEKVAPKKVASSQQNQWFIGLVETISVMIPSRFFIRYMRDNERNLISAPPKNREKEIERQNSIFN